MSELRYPQVFLHLVGAQNYGHLKTQTIFIDTMSLEGSLHPSLEKVSVKSLSRDILVRSVP